LPSSDPSARDRCRHCGVAYHAGAPERLTHTDALNFAVTVFSTVGFGDISAKSEATRLVVTGQMFADLIASGSGSGSSWARSAVADSGGRETSAAHRLPGSSPARTLAERAAGQPVHCVLSVYPDWGDAEKVVP
jgi:Ion channel